MTAPTELGLADHSYEGAGLVEFPGSAGIECEFLASQLFNGTLRIRCRAPIDAHERFWSEGAERGNLKGELPDGREVTAEGLLTVESSLKSEDGASVVLATLHASSIRVAAGSPPAVAELRFGLTNLRLIGDEAYVEVGPGDRHWGGRELRVKLGSTEVVLRQMADYRKNTRWSTDIRSAAVTCEARVRVVDGSEIAGARAILDHLCLLLTLARGCRVNWIYYEALAMDGAFVEAFHADAPTRAPGTLELISSAEPLDTRVFLEQSFPNLAEAQTSWRISDMIKLYTDGKAEEDHLEARTLKLVVALDTLRALFLERRGRSTIIDRALFEGRRGAVETQVRQLLGKIFPEFSDALIEKMSVHVRGMNWYPMRRAIRELAADLRIPISPGEIGRAVEIRNRLVHSASFDRSLGSPFEQYATIMTLVAKILLAALGYRSYFYDWTRHRPGRTTGKDLRVSMEEAT